VSYQIEDVLDRLKGQTSQLFLTQNDQQPSLAERSLISNLRKGMNLPVQTLTQSRSVAQLHQSVYTAQNLSYPQQVDFTRLSADEAEEVEFYMSKIDSLERDHKHMETHSIKLLQNTYHK